MNVVDVIIFSVFVVFCFLLFGYGIIYTNISAQKNVIRGREVIIEDTNRNCYQNTLGLEKIEVSQLSQCINRLKQETEYKIFTSEISKNRYVVSSEQKNSGSFFEICDAYCSTRNTKGICVSSSPSYQNCISELKPDIDCSNLSKPVGYLEDEELKDVIIYYAVTAVPNPEFCTNFQPGTVLN